MEIQQKFTPNNKQVKVIFIPIQNEFVQVSKTLTTHF